MSKEVSREIAERHAGDDMILQGMLRRGLPLNRETYIAMNWPDEPAEWTAEHEEQVPEIFHDPDALPKMKKNYDVP